MFFKDIDAWGKAKLRAITILCGICYMVFSTAIPVIIISTKYNLTKNCTFKTSAIGLIVVIFISTMGIKSLKWLVSIIPDIKKSQQIIRFGLEMLFELAMVGIIIYIKYLIKTSMEQALFCIEYSAYSYAMAIVIENTCIKPLKVQWRCEAKVDENEKLDAIKTNRKK